jgi:hypothetical protein
MEEETLKKIILLQKSKISQLENKLYELQKTFDARMNKKAMNIASSSVTTEDILREAIINIQSHKWVEAAGLI